MKITAFTLAIAAGLLSSTVFAAGVALPDTKIITTAACTMLNEDTKINTSKDVQAGYKCDTGNNVLAVATCHPNGSRKSTVFPCVGQDTDNDGVADKFTPNGCTATTPSIEVKEARGYSVYNTGGSVGVENLSETCTNASIAAKLQ